MDCNYTTIKTCELKGSTFRTHLLNFGDFDISDYSFSVNFNKGEAYKYGGFPLDKLGNIVSLSLNPIENKSGLVHAEVWMEKDGVRSLVVFVDVTITSENCGCTDDTSHDINIVFQEMVIPVTVTKSITEITQNNYLNYENLTPEQQADLRFNWEDFTPENIAELQAPAIEAATIATTATQNANEATEDAQVATEEAQTATTAANEATADATTATNNANTAAGFATSATQEAATATGQATAAATSANSAATAANSAATNANDKAAIAQTAATNADQKAALANNAAANANTAAQNALSGIKGVAVPTTVPEATGFHRYLVHTAGTYTNFKDSGGASIVVSDEDLVGNIVYLEVTDGVSKKNIVPFQTFISSAKIPTWAAAAYTAGSQVIYEGKIYEANSTTASADVPGESTKWVDLNVGSKDYVNYLLQGFVNEYVDYTQSDFTADGYVRTDGILMPLSGCFYKKDIPAVSHIFLSGRTWNSSDAGDLKTVLGKRADGTLFTIFHAQDITLTDQKIDIPNEAVSFSVNISGAINLKIVAPVEPVKKQLEDAGIYAAATALQSFLLPSEGNTPIATTNAVPGTLQNNNTNANPGSARSKVLMNIPKKGDMVSLNMMRTGENADNINLYPSVVGVKDDGSVLTLLPNAIISLNEPQKIFEIALQNDIASISICYSNNAAFEGYFYNKKAITTGPDSVKKYIDEKTGDNYNPYQTERLRYFARPTHLARLEITGFLPTDAAGTKVEVAAKLYANNTLLLKSKAKMSLQGSSSLHLYVKKNFTIDLINDDNEGVDVKIGHWEAFDSFHLKAYATDLTMARDVGSATLWHKIRTNRPYPSNMISSSAVTGMNDTAKSNSYDGALFYTDGFPIEMWVNGEYHGLFVWRIKKDVKNYRLDNAIKTHYFLANSNTNDLKWNAFDASQWELKSPKLPGYAENGPIQDAEVLAGINRLWTWFEQVRTNAVDFESTAAQYINLDSFVDYIISMQMVHHWDHWANNMILVSWDGLIWSLVPYDMDFSVGRLSPYWSFTANPGQLVWRGTFWSNTMYPKLLSRIKTRWQALRSTGFVTPRLYQDCYKPFFTAIGRNLYQTEGAKWEFVEENTGKDNLNYFLQFANGKINYLDTIWNQ